MKPESLIFDIDGTLWDSRALVAQGYDLQLQAEGLDHLRVTADDLTPLFGKVMTQIADALFASIPQDRRYDLMARCMDTEDRYLRDHATADLGYPRVRQTLEDLAKGHRLFIVSNSQQGYPALCMDKLGIAHLIQGHKCFGDTGLDKGATIRLLMEEHQIQSAVYIGDTQGDLEAAEAAQIGFIYAAYGFGRPARWDARIERFQDLKEVLK